MATIKIKNTTINDEAVDLVEGEMAYSEKSGKLFIGSRDGTTIYTIGGQSDHDLLESIVPGDFNFMWKQDTTPTDPAVTEGDLWYNTFSGDFRILRGVTWERLPFVREMAGDFGALTFDDGYF